MWHGLLVNFAGVVSAVAIWATVGDRLARYGPRIERIALGLTMGAAAALALTLAFPIEPGVLFDLRAAPLAVAGYFGGPLSAAIAAVLALMMRLSIGGAGQSAGCLSIVTVSIFATVLRASMRSRGEREPDVLQLAVGCSLVFTTGFLVLPLDRIWPALVAMGAPAAALNVIGIGTVGLLVAREERRRELVGVNALHRAVMDALPDTLNVKDLEGRFMAANPATARLMLAASPDDLIGRTDYDFYPAETAARFRADEIAIQQSDRESTIEQEAVFQDGSSVWLSSRKAPLRDASGRTIGLITNNRDITDQKALLATLQRTRRLLGEAVENMADGLIMYDREGRVLICNSKCRALFPVTADLQVPGAMLGDILRAGIARGEQHLPDGMALEPWVSGMLADIRSSRNRVIPMADGRFLAARDRPATDGGFLTLFSDMTAERHRELELLHRAERDPLTKLANRSTFEAQLTELYRLASAGTVNFSVMLIDLDRFKQVNDTLGHGAGDELLVAVARRLERACRSSDDVARLGGDEFAVLARGEPGGKGMAELAQRILDAVCEPLQFDAVTLRPSCSIGYATFSQRFETPATLVSQADAALYAAKRAGRRRWMADDPSKALRSA